MALHGDRGADAWRLGNGRIGRDHQRSGEYVKRRCVPLQVSDLVVVATRVTDSIMV